MKIVLTGSDAKDEEVEVAIEKPLVDGDDWTFYTNDGQFTISNLTEVMDFLRRMTRR